LSVKKVLFEDGSKKVSETESEDQLLQAFTDNIVSTDGKKNGRVKGKGVINNAIAIHVFEFLESYHLKTHFMNKENEREMKVKNTEKVPITIEIHNISSPQLSKKYGFEKKSQLPVPVIEFYYNNSKLNRPMINEFHATALEVCTQDEMRTMARDALKANAILKPFFERRNINLAGFRLQFGRYKGHLIINSEIIPDTCWLIEKETGDPIGHECFDRDLGNVSETYRDVHERIVGDN